MVNQQEQNNFSSKIKQEKIVRVGLLSDILYAIPMISVAIYSNSMVLMSEFLYYSHSITVNLICWLIIRRIQKNKIPVGDYGSEKLESLGTLFVSILMLIGFVALSILSFQRIVSPQPIHPVFSLFGIGMQIVEMVFTIWMWVNAKKESQKTKSGIMETQWRMNRFYTLQSIAIITSLLISILFKNFTWSFLVDPISGIILIFWVSISFIKLIYEELGDILDKTLCEESKIKILKYLAENFDGYDALKGIRTRKAGAQIFIEIMLGFDAQRTIGEALKVKSNLQKSLEKDFPGCDVSLSLFSAD